MIKQSTKRIWLLLAWGVVFATITCGGSFKKAETSKAREPEVIEYVELVNPQDSIKQELISEVDTYIKSTFPESEVTPDSLVEVCLKHDFNITFALAQGAIESGMGTKGRAKRTNSVWNVGAYDNRPQLKGFIYQDPDNSIEPYVLLVKNKYMGGVLSHHDLMKNYVVYNTTTRYASNKNYEKQLKDLYHKIKSKTRIEELQNLYDTARPRLKPQVS